MLNELIEAKMEIRLCHDPHAALAVLDRLEDRQAASEYRFIGEAADVWRALSLLALDENEPRACPTRARGRHDDRQ